jgi:tetratricopeptide (TPR) repeat protein
MNRRTSLIPLAFLLTACAGQPSLEQPVATTEAVEKPAIEVVERPIPADSVYPLLVAEFALRRRDYDTAMAQYAEQAPLLRDPAVSSHATHLAQYLQKEPEALAAVQLWVELEPDNTEANNTLAILLVRRGRNLDAAPHLGVVAKAGEEANFPILLNGFERMPETTRTQLVATINQLASEFPRDTQILLTQALLHEELGQTDLAQAKLEQLFKLDPYQYQAVLMEARQLLKDEAKDPFYRIELALEAQPNNQELRLQYARMLTRSDMDAARKQFEILSAQSPEDADLLMSLALINRETGDNLTAKAYLNQMLDLGQRTDDANLYLGRIAEDEQDPEQAIAHYMRVQQGREYYNANGRIGGILIDDGQSDRLNAYFNVLRSRTPERAERLYAIQADLHSQRSDSEAAIRVLNQALEELPESASLRYTRSMLGEQVDDLALMESDLRILIEQNPNNATALNALGYTLANRTDRYQEAEELIGRALVLQPEEPAILDSMGWVLYRLGRLDEAISYLKRAYARFPDPEVAAHLGEVLWQNGESEAAVAIWQGALKKNPDHQILLDTLLRLGVPDLIAGN